MCVIKGDTRSLDYGSYALELRAWGLLSEGLSKQVEKGHSSGCYIRYRYTYYVLLTL